MRDADVRAALMPRLRAWHPESDVLVVDELDLLGQVRVDVAVVNGALRGYEIKSARDTLRRLPRQVEIYSQILDYACLVVAECHLEAARALVPSWWEIAVVVQDAGTLRIDRQRPGTPNPSVDPQALVQLLWHEEALELLAERGMDRGVRTKPRRHAWDRLVERLERHELRAAVRWQLKNRRGWREPSSPA